MKLAFLLFEYFPYGGLQRDMVAIATKALERGHQVTVLTRAWHGDPAPSKAWKCAHCRPPPAATTPATRISPAA